MLTVISVSCDNNATSPVSVVTTVSILPENMDIEIGQTWQVQVEVLDQDNVEMTEIQLSFSSADPAVASVDSTGLITGISSGYVVVTVTAEQVTAACDVTVFEVEYELPAGLPEGFPVQFDQTTGNPLNCWGGGGGYINSSPIIFIHGNYNSADNWRDVAEFLLGFGYVPNELWAVTYQDVSGGATSNANLSNMLDIENFVSDVLEYTGEDKVAIIGHSLGVTLGRAWMKEYNRYTSVSHFIGIAGANHGVNFCGPASPSHSSPLCLEIGHPDSDFLTWLNQDDETPFDDIVQYMTLYSGTNLDYFYPSSAVMYDGSTMDLWHSPLLEGAFNVQVPTDHMSIRTNMVSITEMANFMN